MVGGCSFFHKVFCQNPLYRAYWNNPSVSSTFGTGYRYLWTLAFSSLKSTQILTSHVFLRTPFWHTMLLVWWLWKWHPVVPSDSVSVPLSDKGVLGHFEVRSMNLTCSYAWGNRFTISGTSVFTTSFRYANCQAVMACSPTKFVFNPLGAAVILRHQ